MTTQIAINASLRKLLWGIFMSTTYDIYLFTLFCFVKNTYFFKSLK